MSTKTLSITTEHILNEKWFKIANHDSMRPFFMSIVSDSNHWMFISSNGGLTAGRKNNQFALFPYYTDDKITEFADFTGSKTIFQVRSRAAEGVQVWEPFSERFTGKYSLSRSLYKNFFGNKIMFEEVNHDLGLTFRYQWNSSNLYGFVRKSELVNHSDGEVQVVLLDGIQNIMPYGVDPDLQTNTSNLVDAYKRSELVRESGLGIYALSAIIVDKAEPSEALKANVVWSRGLSEAGHLLSSLQLNTFRNLGKVDKETDIKGEKGAYFLHTDLTLNSGSAKNWKIVANVNQNHSQIVALNRAIQTQADLDDVIEKDIARGTQALQQLIAGADGLRKSQDLLKDARHYSNVLFNIMRGGTFDLNYQVEKHDLLEYIRGANKDVFTRNASFLESLPDRFEKKELDNHLNNCSDADLYRLCKEYLPLKFSRRHGDPSRPWNRFSINTHSEVDGSKILDYEGNWRDIFQNWEALVHSYPGFIEGMIFKFLNASTFDGYNPYRVTKGGFDWETIEPDNPWSYIGYWGDHQIIYLLKFLEFYEQHSPEAMFDLFGKDIFVYADVPYRIKPYADIAKDPKNTIDFDEASDHSIRARVELLGADGALLRNHSEVIHRVNFLEKILASVLAKMSNYIPEAGIWMNTQRPEWNDANNALVGNGVSMVTLYYLRRFLKFFEGVMADATTEDVQISEELAGMFREVLKVLESHASLIGKPFSNHDRKRVTESLGKAGGAYRTRIYKSGFSGGKSKLTREEMSRFIGVSLSHLEHSIEANRRKDNLYHSYNIMTMEPDGVRVEYLSEMLEGQVAVLSSGYLGFDESANVLDALRNSALYRSDQNSYMLYPNKDLPRFLEKNSIPASAIEKSELLKTLIADHNNRVVVKDIDGGFHFNGNFRNANDLKQALVQLKSGKYDGLVEKDFDTVMQVFEEVFNHKSFTGRSGTFFAFEGLGSIYWHMVSKLHLAVMEVTQKAALSQAGCLDRLRKHFYEIGEGIGVHKSPDVYGAFPTDPYSHTPQHRGAQQPGMTGQVKEDILVSLGELGISVSNGELSFMPKFLRKAEFTRETQELNFIDLLQEEQTISLPEHALGFSYCQVQVIYQISDNDGVAITFADGSKKCYDSLAVEREVSRQIFDRTGQVKQIDVYLRESHLT